MTKVLVVKPYGWWRPGDKCTVLDILHGGKEFRVQADKGGPLVRLNKTFIRRIM